MESHTVKLTDHQFNEMVTQHKLMLVDFWAPWCGPCMQLGPVIDQLAALYQGKALIAKLNIDDCGAMPRKYAIKTIPTLLIFHQGVPVERLIGNIPMADIQAALDQYVSEV